MPSARITASSTPSRRGASRAPQVLAACVGLAFSCLAHAGPVVLDCRLEHYEPQVFKIDPVEGTWHQWREKYGWGKRCERQPLVRGDWRDSCDYLPLSFVWEHIDGDVTKLTRIDRSDGSVVVSTVYKSHTELNETVRGSCSVGKEPELPRAIF